MEKNKNILIGGLLAIVLVMAVGYAAFATQLNINGTAQISSTWNVHFDDTKTSGTGVIDTTTGLSGATAPTGTITFADDLNATITANLNQPGDKVVFTFTIKNDGTLSAKAATPTLSSEDSDVSISGLTATKGHIKYTVTEPALTTLTAGNTTTMTVTAEYTDVSQNETITATSASIKVTLNYTQA